MPADKSRPNNGGQLATGGRGLTSNYRVPNSIFGSFVRHQAAFVFRDDASVGIAIAPQRAF
jgi:hypothetical protein